MSPSTQAATAARRSHIVELADAQLLSFRDRPGTRLQVLHGGLWLTEERSTQDRFAGAGEWLALEGGGHTLAEALGPTRVRVLEARRRPAGVWLRWLRHRWPRVEALAMRSLAVMLALVLAIGLPEIVARGFLGRIDAARADRAASADTASPGTENMRVRLARVAPRLAQRGRSGGVSRA